MNAYRPVFTETPTEPHHDLNMGSGQDQYNTLPVTSVVREDSRGQKYFVSVSRWMLTSEERLQIAGGADIVHQVIHTIGAYPPMHLQVCDDNQNPVLVRGE